MSKHEMPAFSMLIENGRLVPATPYDQERLLSFTRGTKVKVRFTEEKDRVLVKKWWAILGLVVKQCNTPWTTKEEASEAVKLALGIVNLTKTVQNNYLQYPKSLTELEDPELQEAVDNMTELLSRLTGVDVETLKKETAHIKPEPDEPHDPETGELTEQQTSDDAPDASESDDASSPPAASSKEPEGSVPPPSGSTSSEPDELSSDDRSTLIRCYAKLLAVGDEPDLDIEAKTKILNGAKDVWKAELPEHLHKHLKSFFYSALGVIKGHDKRKAAKEYAGFLECTVEELIGDDHG